MTWKIGDYARFAHPVKNSAQQGGLCRIESVEGCNAIDVHYMVRTIPTGDRFIVSPEELTGSGPSLADRMQAYAEDRPEAARVFVEHIQALRSINFATMTAPQIAGIVAKARIAWCEITGDSY